MLDIRYGLIDDAAEILELQNKYLSFGIASIENIIEKINKKEYLVALLDNKVVGIRGFDPYPNIETELIHEDLLNKFINLELKNVCLAKGITVDENYRGMGIATELLRKYHNIMSDFDHLCIGWLKPRPVGWEAERLFLKEGYNILYLKENFWTPLELPCPYCGDICNCSAIIAYKKYNNKYYL